MPVCKTVEEYVQLVGPHQQHPFQRADKPRERLMGIRCPQDGAEAYISIADFRETGDLPKYEELIDPFLPEDKRKKKK